MKHIIKLIPFILTISLFARCGPGDNGSQSKSDSTNAPAPRPAASPLLSPLTHLNPDTLVCLDSLKKTPLQAIAVNASFGTDFRAVVSGQTINYAQVSYSDNIPVDTIKALRNTKNITADSQSLALRIRYGFNSTQKVPVIIYEPVVMKADSSSHGMIYFHLVDTGTFYTFNSGTKHFDALPAATAASYFADFLSRTQVYNGAAFVAINNNDAKSVIFPWVELDSLIRQNDTALQHNYARYAALARLLFANKDKLHTISFVPRSGDTMVYAHPRFDNVQPIVTSVVFSYSAVAGTGGTSKFLATVTMNPVLAGPNYTIPAGLLTGMCADMGAMCPFNCPPTLKFYICSPGQ